MNEWLEYTYMFSVYEQGRGECFYDLCLHLLMAIYLEI
jgi:hypothetical protein